MKQQCKTCRFLYIEPNAQGKIVVRKGFAYECRAIVSMPKLPDSITRDYRFQWPMGRTYMQGSDGATCPMWDERL